MFDTLKKFFARFYSDKPDMLMPAVPPAPEDDEVMVDEQHRAAIMAHKQLAQADAEANEDQDLPPPANG